MEKRYKYKMFHLATLFKYKMFYLVMTSSAVWKKKVSKKKKTYMVWEGQGGVVERAHGVGAKKMRSLAVVHHGLLLSFPGSFFHSRILTHLVNTTLISPGKFNLNILIVVIPGCLCFRFLLFCFLVLIFIENGVRGCVFFERCWWE